MILPWHVISKNIRGPINDGQTIDQWLLDQMVRGLKSQPPYWFHGYKLHDLLDLCFLNVGKSAFILCLRFPDVTTRRIQYVAGYILL